MMQAYKKAKQLTAKWEQERKDNKRLATIKEAADTKRWEWYEEGDLVDAFCSLKELNKCIETIRKIFPEDKWNVVIKRRI